jgi:hypothetical protein
MKMDSKQISRFSNYWPLISLLLISILEASALCYGKSVPWMHAFMGLLFCQFALLKFFDLSGFADGFQMYDLLAKKSRSYALAYPMIELALGLGYLSFINPVLIYALTIFFMAVGTLGVIIALNKGLDTFCACMGSILKVPLSTVTLTEDIGMGMMALFMLIYTRSVS